MVSGHFRSVKARGTLVLLCAGHVTLTSLWMSGLRPATDHRVFDVLFTVASAVILFVMVRAASAMRDAGVKDAEHRYRSLFDYSLDCLFMIDLQGRIVDANRPALELVGYRRDELGTFAVQDVVSPDQLADAVADIARVLAKEPDAEPKEWTLRRKDGGLVEVESRIAPVMVDGAPYAVQGIARDITRRKGQERALRESESRFQQLAEGIRDVFWLAPADYQSILYVSPAFEQIWGRSVAELMASPFLWLDAVHADDRPRVLDAVTALAAGTPYDIEFRILRPDGTERWINDRGFPVRDANGVVTVTAGLAADVTARRQADEQLRLASTVFEHSREGILIAGPDNRILSVNKAFTEITGYSSAEVVGSTPALLKSGRQDNAFYERLWNSLSRDGHWSGMIWNRRKTGEVYPEWLAITEVHSPAGELTHRVGIFSDISERLNSEDRIQHLAQFDLLTDLPNRVLLTDRTQVALAQAERHQRHAALLFLDLDRFKLINDTLGHEVGDALLQCVADRFRRITRATDTISRYGGDEFVVLLTDADAAQAGCVAEHLMRVLAEPIQIGERQLHISGSIGIAVYPDHGHDMTTLLRHADAAMYAAKESGRSAYRFYSKGLNARAAERLSLENDLRRAIEQNELFVAYQPQVSLATGDIMGVEALARWRHSTAGLIPPNRFIPIAEETGLIVPIGQWLMRAACRQTADWRRRGLAHVGVAVNVSPTELHQRHFRHNIEQILQQEHVAAGDIELEVTESAILGGAQTLLPHLEALKELGVRLAIDDFGTGYSSLSYLRHLPIHRLKIDRAFVSDLPHNKDAAAIALAIVQMGHSLGLSVIAEGVETEEQSDYLRSIGCDEAQGYLFARPLLPDEFERWQANWRDEGAIELTRSVQAV